MKKIIAVIFSLFLLTAYGAQTYAQDISEKTHVKFTMTPEFSDVRPGDTVFIAINQKLDDHWHTYWHNPGDSGQPPRFTWDLPPGFEMKTLSWPVPKPIPTGPLTSFGYEQEATLIQEMLVPVDMPSGPLEIKATIDVLVCKEICIPEFHEYSFVLNEGKNQINDEIISAAFDKLPTEVSWPAFYKEDENGDFVIDLEFQQPELITQGDVNVRFEVLPHEWGIIDNSAKTRVKMEKRDTFHLLFRKQRGDRPLEKLGKLKTLVSYDIANSESETLQALELTLSPDPEWLSAITEQSIIEETQSTAENSDDKSELTLDEYTPSPPNTNLLKAIIFAFLGGLILNLMPCVFPVLSMKALSLVKMAESSPRTVKLSGLSYTAGVLLSFSVIALSLLALKAAGSQIGWGFQLQNPVVVLSLAYLLFIIGLNLSGFFEITSRLSNIGTGLTDKGSFIGSFFTGVLVTLVATPCTAPFMGVALGYALTQPALVSYLVFTALGLGLAFPYLLLSYAPALRTLLPNPGNWMVVFKELLAFPIYASAVWLVWVYSQQVGAISLLYALTGFVGISFFVWILRYTPDSRGGKIAMRFFAALVLLTVMGIAFSESLKTKPSQVSEQIIESSLSRPYTEASLMEALQGEQPVFVNMTAAWCITCKVNERIALNIDETMKLFEEKNVVYFKGDWTNQDPEITKFLSRYGRNGVPIYVYYGAPDNATGNRPEAEVLPQILTPNIIKNVIENE